MTFLGDFNYALDTIYQCQHLAQALWNSGKHYDAVLLIHESKEILHRLNFTGKSKSFPPDFDEILHQFYNENPRVKAAFRNRHYQNTTRGLWQRMTKGINTEKVIDKAYREWHNHNFEGALDILAMAIERVFNSAYEEDLDVLIELFNRYKKQWASFLVEAAEKRVQAILDGQERFKKSILLELEKIIVRAYKLSPSGVEGNTGTLLVTILRMLVVHERSRDTVKLLDAGRLETANRQLKSLVNLQYIPLLKQLQETVTSRLNNVARLHTLLEAKIQTGEIEIAHETLNRIKNLNREYPVIGSIEQKIEEIKGLYLLLNKARISGSLIDFENVINSCRMIIASYSHIEWAHAFLKNSAREFESVVIKKLDALESNPEEALKIIERFSKTVPLSFTLEKMKLKITNQLEQSDSLTNACLQDIADFRFSVARAKLDDMKAVAHDEKLVRILENQIRDGEEAISLFGKARKKLKTGDFAGAAEICQNILHTMPLPAAQKLYNSLIDKIALKSDFTLVSIENNYIILRESEIKIGRSEKSRYSFHINFHDYPLDISPQGHATIHQQDRHFVLEDMKSPFGTFLDDVEINGQQILPLKAKIKLGQNVLFEWKIVTSSKIIGGFNSLNDHQPSAIMNVKRILLPQGSDSKKWPNYREMKRNVYILAGPVLTIGASPECTIQVRGDNVLEWACVLFREQAGATMLRPLSENSAVSVNDRLISEDYLVKLNDVIRVGEVKLSVGAYPPMDNT